METFLFAADWILLPMLIVLAHRKNPRVLTITTAVIALTAVEFLIFGLSYRRQNKISMISVFIMLLVGIGLQEILGSEYRTAYIAMTICVALMFIHYAEFYKMDADEQISQQHIQLMKDVLTGVFSRYAYTKDIERYR